MKQLYFVRHGLSEMNKLGVYAGRADTPLTETGRQQAKTAGEQARNLTMDCVVASPLKRALETAQIIAKEIDYPEERIIINNLLTERDFGSMEGKPWGLDADLEGKPGVESVDELYQRALRAYSWLHSLEHHSILVVSHGSFGEALRAIISAENGSQFPDDLHNATIYQWL